MRTMRRFIRNYRAEVIITVMWGCALVGVAWIHGECPGRLLASVFGM